MPTYGKAYIVKAAVAATRATNGTIWAGPGSDGFAQLNVAAAAATDNFTVLVGGQVAYSSPGAGGGAGVSPMQATVFVGPSQAVTMARTSGTCYVTGVEFENA